MPQVDCMERATSDTEVTASLLETVDAKLIHFTFMRRVFTSVTCHSAEVVDRVTGLGDGIASPSPEKTRGRDGDGFLQPKKRRDGEC